jgi:septal ring factor EnvC (AmiA/AmiB activator)
VRNFPQIPEPERPGLLARRLGDICSRFLRGRARYLPPVLFFLALIPVRPDQVWAEDQAIETHRRDLADVERRVKDLAQDLEGRRDRRQSLLAELEQSERDIADLARGSHQLSVMLGEQERALAKLRKRLASEREALDRERVALASLLRSVYAMGPGDHIRMLLDREDSSRLSRVMSYYDFLNRYRIGRIKAVARRARALGGLRREAEREKVRLSSLAQRQEETLARMSAAQDERSALVASLENTIATKSEGIEDLRAQAREMRALLEQLERQARVLPEADLRQEPLKQLRGRLPWPIANAPLASHYDSAKGEGTQRWDGVVLKAEEGAEVRAVHPGRVVYADWLRGFGLLIIIEHEDNYMTLYGYNQTLLKEPGEWVAAGDIIALSGSSGGRVSPGLYFAIRYRGRPLNPEQWCGPDAMGGRKSSAANFPAMEHVGISLLQCGECRTPPAPVSSISSTFMNRFFSNLSS